MGQIGKRFEVDFGCLEVGFLDAKILRFLGLLGFCLKQRKKGLMLGYCQPFWMEGSSDTKIDINRIVAEFSKPYQTMLSGILEKGLRWRVGDGTTIRVYKDSWVPRPWNLKIISAPVLGTNATVDDLFLPSGGWDTKKLNENFMHRNVEAILKIPFGVKNNKDAIIWQFKGNGSYSVKSEYWLG
ncbi:hypothetical protein Dsin_001492 [Dipteronia sinensis]|uniref:Uncharacterized protein n=1 Tax=Dipteronia sinensis TaxID=43782 RepID=A0AAE0EII1_9ROSI|nr:hypothetical protein Dsin_001492 [Dipteronia sinensis]